MLGYMEITDETLDVLLGALADQLQALGSQVEIVVIGGSALITLGLVSV
jgi:CHASE3 domain sensor protein